MFQVDLEKLSKELESLSDDIGVLARILADLGIGVENSELVDQIVFERLTRKDNPNI